MELKFGHRVIALCNNNPEKHKGRFVSNEGDDTGGSNWLINWVLIDDQDFPEPFDIAELDPDATEFLRGDDVEMSLDKKSWKTKILYGHPGKQNGHYDLDGMYWNYCRYPRKDAFHDKAEMVDEEKHGLRMVRASELSEILGVSKATLWRWEKDGHLPPRKKFGPGKTIGWLSTDIDDYLEQLPNANDLK